MHEIKASKGQNRERHSSSHGKIVVSPKHTFTQKLFGKPFTSTKAGKPSDKSELQSRTRGSGSSVVGKARTEVVGSFAELKSPDMRRSLLEQIKIPDYYFREKIEAIFDRGLIHLRPLAAPFIFSCLSFSSSLPSPPFLQSGDRHDDRWT